MWKLSHIFFWRHICAKIDIEKKYFRTHISFLYRYEKSLSLLIWFHEKKYLPMYFQKLSYVMSHVNIIMIYLWVTYIKIKNGVFKIVLGGSSILNFFYNAVKMPNSYSSWSANGSLFSHTKTPSPLPPIQGMFYADKFGLYKLGSHKKKSNNTSQKTIWETWKFWLL